MIVTEYYMTRSDGTILNRTYSDAGYLIERDGALYRDAVDPEGSGREYTETTQLIENAIMTETEAKALAYDILTGVTE